MEGVTIKGILGTIGEIGKWILRVINQSALSVLIVALCLFRSVSLSFTVSQLTPKWCRKIHNAASAYHAWWVEAVTAKAATYCRSGNLGEGCTFKIKGLLPTLCFQV